MLRPSPVSADETTRAVSHIRPRPRGRFRLIVTAGPDRGLSRDVDGGEIRIGKGADNELPLTDPTVSRHHCAVVAAPFGPLVRDLGSRNGVRIDGNWVESAYLRPGALIRIGDTAVLLESVESADAATASDPAGRLGAALGKSAAMQRIFALVPRLANSDATLLIEGETGTGKTMLAEVIHRESPRQNGPFVVIDCAAIPAGLMESELLGHERGAFTGAASTRAGAFEAASGGTVLLDEIGELPLEMQPKLLRAIEQRVVRRVGSNEDRPMNVRITTATNRNLEDEVKQGRFRTDLYYRLATVRIAVPPLRQRREDIPSLANHFLRAFTDDAAAELPPAMLDTFMRQSWPGNVRELRNAVERAILLGDLAPVTESPLMPIAPPSEEPAPEADEALPFREVKERAIDAWERGYLERLVKRADGNISRASRMAQMDRNHLRELLRKHRVEI